MTTTLRASTFKSLAFVLIMLAVVVFCILVLFLPSWRYDAFPAEERIAQNIEQAAYGTQYKHSDLDYCIPKPGLPVCSASTLPGTECYFPRCRWGHVTTLSLSGGQFAELPVEVVRLPGLVGLDLSQNRLAGLSPQIGQLRSIKRLDLSNNLLGSVPPEIGQLSNLTELDLSGNQLTSIPPEIGQLRNLTSLNLGDNPLSGPLPKILTQLPLVHFEFSKTGLCVPVDGEFQKWIQAVSAHSSEGSPLYSLHDLCSLAVEDQSAMRALYETPGRPEDWNLQTLPCTWSGVGCDSAGHIITLDLLSAKFSQLPPEIGELGALQFLRLSYAQLEELPREIGKLHSLTYLELIHNQLSSLPPEIGQLRNLQTLELESNQLTGLPPQISLLTNLKWLNVCHNPLNGPLPGFLTALPNVRFVFEDTNLCIPNDDALLNWLRRQAAGYYRAAGGDFVYVPPSPQTEIDRLLENRGCD